MAKLVKREPVPEDERDGSRAAPRHSLPERLERLEIAIEQARADLGRCVELTKRCVELTKRLVLLLRRLPPPGRAKAKGKS
jgi:hypothetical protein